MPRFLLLPLCALLCTSAGADWRSVDADSRLEFVPTYDGVALPGRFSRFEVRLQLDPDALGDACLDVSIDVASADLDDPDLNEGIAGPEWFDFQRFPRARFTSTRIFSGADPGAFVAHGELQLKGYSRPVSVPFHWTWSGDRAELQGDVTLRRSDYSIGTGAWADDDTIGQGVKVRFHVVLRSQP